MSKKLLGKIFCCLFSVALVVPSTSAFDFDFNRFFKSEKSLEEVKAAYDSSVESFEGSKVEYQKFFEDLGLALSEIEGAKGDYKFYFEKSNEQLKKLNDAYDAWASEFYPISGEKYEAYRSAKEAFDEASCACDLQKEVLESNLEKLKSLFAQYDKILAGYMDNLKNSVCNYHDYGIALIKNDMKKA